MQAGQLCKHILGPFFKIFSYFSRQGLVSHSWAQTVLSPQLPSVWDFGHAPPCLVSITFFFFFPLWLLFCLFSFKTPCSSHPRTWCQITNNRPNPEPTKMIHTSQSQACLPCLACSFHRKHSTGCVGDSPLAAFDPDLFGCFLCGPVCQGAPPPLENGGRSVATTS